MTKALDWDSGREQVPVPAQSIQTQSSPDSNITNPLKLRINANLIYQEVFKHVKFTLTRQQFWTIFVQVNGKKMLLRNSFKASHPNKTMSLASCLVGAIFKQVRNTLRRSASIVFAKITNALLIECRVNGRDDRKLFGPTVLAMSFFFKLNMKHLNRSIAFLSVKLLARIDLYKLLRLMFWFTSRKAANSNVRGQKTKMLRSYLTILVGWVLSVVSNEMCLVLPHESRLLSDLTTPC